MSGGFGQVLITESFRHSFIGSGVAARTVGHMDAIPLDDQDHPERRRMNRDGKSRYFEVVFSTDESWLKGRRLPTMTFAMSLHTGCFELGTIFLCPDGIQRTVTQVVNGNNHIASYALVDAEGHKLCLRVYNRPRRHYHKQLQQEQEP